MELIKFRQKQNVLIKGPCNFENKIIKLPTFLVQLSLVDYLGWRSKPWKCILKLLHQFLLEPQFIFRITLKLNTLLTLISSPYSLHLQSFFKLDLIWNKNAHIQNSICKANQVVIAQWLTWQLATGEVLG